MKLMIALFAAMLVAAPLSAQEEPKVERKEVRTAKVVKIENGKVVELEGEAAEAEMKKMRAEMEKLRKEVEDKLKGIKPADDDGESEIPDVEDALDDLGDLPGLSEEMRKRFKEIMEKAKAAARKAQEQGGDVDVEIEETSEDGSSQVKIRIVRKTGKSSESTPAPEAPKEAPKSERQQ